MADNLNPVEEAPAAEQPTNPADVEMGEGGDDTAAGAAADTTEITFPLDDDENPPRTPFISYLTSHIVTLLVGSGGSETVLTAHQALLTQSPFFAQSCAAFVDDGSVGVFWFRACLSWLLIR